MSDTRTKKRTKKTLPPPPELLPLFYELAANNINLLKRGILTIIENNTLKPDRQISVEDVCQEALIAIWADLAYWNPKRAPFTSWAVLKAQSVARDACRKYIRRAIIASDEYQGQDVGIDSNTNAVIVVKPARQDNDCDNWLDALRIDSTQRK